MEKMTLKQAKEQFEPFNIDLLRPLERRLYDHIQRERPALISYMRKNFILLKTLSVAHDHLFLVDVENRDVIRKNLGVPPQTEAARKEYNLRMDAAARDKLRSELQRWTTKVLSENDFTE